MFLRLARGAAEDEQIGGAEEEAAEERLRILIRFLLGKMILHPLQYPGLLLGGAHHEEGVLISSDEQTIILISSSSILHPSWDDAIDRDVDIIGAKLLEIADNSFLLTLDDKLGKTGHINQTNAFSTNMIFVLDMIKELWLRE